MIYKGRVISLSIGSVPIKVAKERNSTLTISSSILSGSGSARCSKHYSQQKSWSIQTQLLITTGVFQTFFSSMASGTTLAIRFSSASGLCVDGSAYISSMSFAGQGKGLVLLNITLQGDGEPTLS